jgi:hypothetical protein
VYKRPKADQNLELQTLNNILLSLTHTKDIMLYSNNSAKLPGAEAMASPSSTAELPDDGFMAQFEAINPPDMHRFDNQPYFDDWSSENYAPDPNLLPYEAFPEEDSTLYPQDPNNRGGLNTHIQCTTSLEQAPEAVDQSQDLQDPNSGGSLNDSQSENLDQLYQNLQSSLENIQDFENRFGLIPDSQFTEFEQCLDMTNQLQYSPNESTTRFSAEMDPIHEFTILGPANNGPVYQPQERPSELANPTPAWIGLVPAVEQPPICHESFPQAPRPSIHTPPNNQHLSADNKLPPQPRREKKRQANIENIDPSKHYQKLSEVPRSWDPRNGSGMLTFQYNEYGELSTNDKFSPGQILEYLYEHPLHYNGNGHYDIENTRLILWIQVTPADSGRRYPYKNSDKCRFADCPIPQNSIRKGFFRVAFDEHTALGRQIDPYHCAGFVHLFCLEKFCDFPRICRDLIVLPDQRILPEGRNKMAVTRDHEEMVEVARTFIQSSQKMMPWDYEQTLCFQLTSKHLELEPTVRVTTRNNRGGNHIGLHKGDLDKFVAGEILKLEQKRAASTQKPPKRKRDITEVEEDITNLENEVAHQQHPIKRGRIWR